MRYFLLHGGQPSAERLARRVPELSPVTEIRSQVTEEDIVIRLGNTVDPDRGAWTVNRRDAVLQTGNRRSMLRALRRAGVRCPGPAGEGEGAEVRMQLVRHYRVPVFNLMPCACFRTDAKSVWLSKRISLVQGHFVEVGADSDDETRRVCQLAVRAAHALGLELALVSLGVTAKDRLIVVDVNAEPVLKGRVLESVAGCVEDFMAAEEKWRRPGAADSILLGTDLEFMMRGRQGKMALASRYFPDRGRVGCDDRSLAGDRRRRPLAELRPRPGKAPEELHRNIEQALKKAVDLAPGAWPQWMAGSAPFPNFPIGGHIHFSGIPYTGRLVNLLDVYVGLPLMLIEDPETASRRRPKYGFLGDVRHKPHGGFEYRTPASFLVDPGVTLGALTLAYVVVQHYPELPYFPLHRADNQRAFYRSDRDYLLPLAEEAHSALARTPAYRRYRVILDPIWEMIREDEVWDETVDVRRAWGVMPQARRQGQRAGADRMRRELAAQGVGP